MPASCGDGGLCSGHGECVAPNSCSCVAGWVGESCALREGDPKAAALSVTALAEGTLAALSTQVLSVETVQLAPAQLADHVEGALVGEGLAVQAEVQPEVMRQFEVRRPLRPFRRPC